MLKMSLFVKVHIAHQEQQVCFSLVKADSSVTYRVNNRPLCLWGRGHQRRLSDVRQTGRSTGDGHQSKAQGLNVNEHAFSERLCFFSFFFFA